MINCQAYTHRCIQGLLRDLKYLLIISLIICKRYLSPINIVKAEDFPIFFFSKNDLNHPSKSFFSLSKSISP